MAGMAEYFRAIPPIGAAKAVRDAVQDMAAMVEKEEREQGTIISLHPATFLAVGAVVEAEDPGQDSATSPMRR